VRVLLVSKAMLSATAQGKADLLAGFPEVELTVVSPPFWRADDGGIQRIEASGVAAQTKPWRLLVTPMRFNGHFHVHYYPELGRVVRQARPDIVHIDEEPYNFATYRALRTAKNLGARALFVTWQNLYRRYPPPFSWLEAYDYAHADYALAANQDAVAVMQKKGYRGPVAVFPQFGADTDLFRPREHATQGPMRIGCVVRLKPEKAVDVLLAAFAPLAGRAELILVGRGPMEEALREQARSLGVADHIQFLGSLSSEGVAEVMASFDVLVLPSRSQPNWTEQFGRVLVEAMACEVAVVGSTSGEIPHVIGDAGLTFPEDDVAVLQAALQRLMDDPALRRELARRGRQRVLERYTQQRIAEQTYEAWRAMLGVPARV
jgi:glycosyltransferase involved in cell wall biosynthesis